VAGRTGSGKTSFCLKLLRNLDTLCTESRFGGGIIWYYSEETVLPRQQLDKLGLNITYQEGLPEIYGNALGEPSLIILDDLLNQVYSKDVCDLLRKAAITEISACYFSLKIYSMRVLIVAIFR